MIDEATTCSMAANDPPSFQEVCLAMSRLDNHKAADEWGIRAEMLKHGGTVLAIELHQLIIKVWNSECIPDDWRQAVLIPIPKAGDKTLVGNYRGICIQAIAAKVYSSILKGRLQNWAESTLSEMQYGFRPRRSCTDAIFTLRCVIDRFLRKGKSLFLCFIDICKAYDSIDRDTAWNTLIHRGAPTKVVSLLRDMHSHTCCSVRLSGMGLGAQFTIETGFKQGDAISPMLFNLYLDSVIQTILPKLQELGVRVVYQVDGVLHDKPLHTLTHREFVYILLYADDIALLSESLADLKSMVEVVHNQFQAWGLAMNFDKTKVMQVGLSHPFSNDLFVAGKRIDMVESFKYLGQIFSHNGSIDLEIQQRISKALLVFNDLRKRGVWSDKVISRSTKIRIYKTTVRSVLLYCAETWPVSQQQIHKLESIQMSCLRRICGYSLLHRKTNIMIRERCRVASISSLLRYHRLRWLGHVCRMAPNRLPLTVLFADINSRGQRGRPQNTWKALIQKDIKDLSEEEGLRGTLINWWDLCRDHKGWMDLISKLADRHI